jgi:hypothetical protein
MVWFATFQQKPVVMVKVGTSLGVRTGENQLELSTSSTTKFPPLPSSVVHWIREKCMFVYKKCDRSKERTNILLFDRFV